MPEVYATDWGFCGNLFIRKIFFPEIDDFVPGHDHKLDHITFVSQGKIHFRCEITGVDRIITAPDFIPTPAQSRHDMVALEKDSCAWCIFANPENTRDKSIFT